MSLWMKPAGGARPDLHHHDGDRHLVEVDAAGMFQTLFADVVQGFRRQSEAAAGMSLLVDQAQDLERVAVEMRQQDVAIRGERRGFRDRALRIAFLGDQLACQISAGRVGRVGKDGVSNLMASRSVSHGRLPLAASISPDVGRAFKRNGTRRLQRNLKRCR
jgi:hypothetical protein